MTCRRDFKPGLGGADALNVEASLDPEVPGHAAQIPKGFFRNRGLGVHLTSPSSNDRGVCGRYALPYMAAAGLKTDCHGSPNVNCAVLDQVGRTVLLYNIQPESVNEVSATPRQVSLIPPA